MPKRWLDNNPVFRLRTNKLVDPAATNPDCFDVNFVFDPLDGNTLLHVAVSESQMV